MRETIHIHSLWHRRGLWMGVLSCLIWCLLGLFLLIAEILPISWQTPVSEWGDCVFLSFAGVMTFLIAGRDFGWKIMGLVILLVFVGSGTAEICSMLTGYPFGNYQYTSRLGVKLLGYIPWVIPVCWLILITNAYIICSVLVAAYSSIVSNRNQLFLIFLTAAVITLVILNLEPVAVNVKQYWYWLERDWSYYGAPKLKFFGWFAVSSILISILSHILDPQHWKLSTAWMSLGLLAGLQFPFAVMNWEAQQYIPVWIALNLTGGLAIGLTCLLEK